MSGLPRGFKRGLVLGGAMAAAWAILGNKSRRDALAEQLMTARGEAFSFPGSRLYALFAGQVMSGIYRTIAEDITAEAKSGQLLELGAGTGHLAVEMARRARDLDVMAMDLSSDMVQMAEARIHAAGLGRQAKVVHGDAKDIPFPEESFDYVVSLLSFHHWSSPEMALAEIHRVLKPGGKALIYDIRRELPEDEVALIRDTFPIYMRPMVDMGVGASKRHAFTEGQISSMATASPFVKGEIKPIEVEISGVPVEIFSKLTLAK